MSELRYGLRMLLREPAFTFTAAAVLALGIGSTTAIFTLVHSLLLEPLPYPDSGRLVWIWDVPPQTGRGIAGLMGSDFTEIRDRNHSFDRVASLIGGIWVVNDGVNSESIPGARVSPGFFETLQVRPMLGRPFIAEEHRLGREMEVIFSYPYWRQRFGGDPTVVGRRMTLDGLTYEVVGIMPPDFALAGEFDMWAPMPMDSSYYTGRRARVRTFGRLKPGLKIAQAQAEADDFAGDFGRRFENERGYSIRLMTFIDREVGEIRGTLWIFAAAVGCLLLISCSNVATLLLARGTARTREMAVRAAVGASRWVLIRQTLVESTMLALLGGALGLPLAMAGVRVLVTLGARALPRAQEIRIDPWVWLFTFVASLVTGLLFGAVPALRGSRVNVGEALKEGGRSGTSGRQRNRLRATLVVTEVALGVVLVAAAGLLARSFLALTHLDPGYRVRGVLTMQVALTSSHYRDAASYRQFFERLLPMIEQIPGVEAAGSTNWLPLRTDKNSTGVWLESQPVHSEETKIRLDNRVVTPGYFRAMGVPLIAGRFFDWSDGPTAPKVVLINEAFAREFFPHGDAVGQRVFIDLGSANPWIGQVVGVTGNFRESSMAEEPRREIFTAYTQTTIAGQALVVRTAGDPASFAAPIRAAIASLDKEVPVYDLRTMQEQVDESLAQHRMRGVLLGVLSGVALALASLGVYGVISCAVIERRQEIGIRLALGGSLDRVRRMIVAEGLKLTALGLALGLILAAGATRLMEGFLFGVSPVDPLTFAATGAVFIVVTLVASYLPVRKATRTDPLAALREE